MQRSEDPRRTPERPAPFDEAEALGHHQHSLETIRIYTDSRGDLGGVDATSGKMPGNVQADEASSQVRREEPIGAIGDHNFGWSQTLGDAQQHAIRNRSEVVPECNL